MKNPQTINDISKETLTFLAYFENEMIEKIPNKVISKLCKEAADSKLDFFIKPNKNFEDQEISEKSKDLISLIYYNYIADDVEKKDLENNWKLNDKNFEILQKEKYNLDNLFKNSSKIDNKYSEKYQETAMIKYKESIFSKIINKIKTIFNK